jgi:hypothetical protein
VEKLAAAGPNSSLALDQNVAVTGNRVTASSAGAQLVLQTDATLTGSKVKLGSGAGKNASLASQAGRNGGPDKSVYVRTRLLRNGRPGGGVAYKLVFDGGVEPGPSLPPAPKQGLRVSRSRFPTSLVECLHWGGPPPARARRARSREGGRTGIDSSERRVEGGARSCHAEGLR